MTSPLSILFVIDPLDGLKESKDSSVAMMREATRRGHRVWACEQAQMAWREGRVAAAVQRLELTPQAHPWFVVAELATRPLETFDAVLMRKDPPFDNEYLYATYLLETAARLGARVFNSPRALRDHNEKLAITEFPDFIAPSLVTCDAEVIRQFQRDHGEIVVKPLDGMGGVSVFRLRPDDPNLNVILETITQFGRRTVMAQRFIPEIAQGDKRILLIAGRPVPYALARVPRPGESRGNLAAGGIGRSQPLSPRDREIAETLGPVLAERGLLLVGLDVIGNHLTEINVTSPTCFVEIKHQTGFNVAAMFIDALEQRIVK
jgi:glutathione synthase